jgi:RHS repeat-associated protein
VPNTTYDLRNDGRQLVERATDPTGAKRSADYTDFSDVKSATNAAGTTTFGHNPAVNGGESLTDVTSPTDTDGNPTTTLDYTNQAPGQYLPSAGTDAQGHSTTYYTATGNFDGAETDAGAIARVERNADGTIRTSTSPSGAVTTYTNTDKQLATIQPDAAADLGDRGYTYDPYGRIKTYQNGRGVTETYSYDAADRVTLIEFSDSTPDVAYSYDTAGRVYTRTDASGTTTYTYDPLGRLATREHTAGGGLLEYHYDLAGNLVSETDAGGTTTHTYDVRNLLISSTTPDSRTIRYDYDADGQRTDTWYASNADHTTWAAHTETAFDASGRIAGITTTRNGSDTLKVSDLSYVYNSPGPSASCPDAPPAGDTSLRWKMQDHVSGNEVTYCYDKSNRLLSATSSDPAEDDWAYTYDENGNRETVTKNGVEVQNFVGDFDIADKLTSGTGYGYDLAGNLTDTPDAQTLTYNVTNQLDSVDDTGAGPDGDYRFAGTTQNELISQTVAGDNYDYTWGRTDNNDLPILQSFSNADGTSYLWHDDAGSPLAMRTSSGSTVYYALDGVGSPVALVNSSGVQVASYDYDPYGEVTVTNLTGSAGDLNPYRFAGGLIDRTTGWVKFGQRFYDPATGRSTQQDSLEVLADPARANRYEYGGSNPVNFIDPTGQSFFADAVGAIAGLVASAALDGILGPVIGGAIGGCAGGAITALVDGSNAATACLQAGAIGAVTGGLARPVAKFFGNRS